MKLFIHIMGDRIYKQKIIKYHYYQYYRRLYNGLFSLFVFNRLLYE